MTCSLTLSFTFGGGWAIKSTSQNPTSYLQNQLNEMRSHSWTETSEKALKLSLCAESFQSEIKTSRISMHEMSNDNFGEKNIRVEHFHWDFHFLRDLSRCDCEYTLGCKTNWKMRYLVMGLKILDLSENSGDVTRLCWFESCSLFVFMKLRLLFHLTCNWILNY